MEPDSLSFLTLINKGQSHSVGGLRGLCFRDTPSQMPECDTSCEEGKSRLYKPILLRISLQIYTRAGFKENCTTLLMKLV